MKTILYSIIFLSLLNVTCVVQKPIIGHKLNGEPIKICDFPVLYEISNDIPKKDVDLIDKSFDDWNKVLGFKAFYKWGIINKKVDETNKYRFLVIGFSSIDKKYCALTYYKFRYNCSTTKKIKVLKECYDKLTPSKKNSLFRHEIGHVLGLGHSDYTFDLMNKNVLNSPLHPVNISRADLEVIDEIYKGLRNGKKEEK